MGKRRRIAVLLFLGVALAGPGTVLAGGGL
jgi:hypothetical protein